MSSSVIGCHLFCTFNGDWENFKSPNTVRAATYASIDEKVMDKIQLLEYLDMNDYAPVDEVANVMEMSYSATAMALLRLVRQDLAARYTDPDTRLYVYEITPKGEARLDYFLEDEFDDC